MTDLHYPAALYELVHRGTAGDLAFYVRVCNAASEREHARVLELGCGYGRVLAALRESSQQQHRRKEKLELTGLERDPDLLARARERLADPSVRLVEGDMTAFAITDEGGEPAAFDRILIPHSGIYCLPDDEACVACFQCCAQHLAPDGRLVFDAYGADVFHIEQDPADHTDERLDPVVSVEHEGICYDVFERSRWERSEQRLDVTYEYIPRGGGEALVGRLMHRYLLRDQLEPLLARAGLQLISLDGDWRGGASTPGGDMWVATAALETSA